MGGLAETHHSRRFSLPAPASFLSYSSHACVGSAHRPAQFSSRRCGLKKPLRRRRPFKDLPRPFVEEPLDAFELVVTRRVHVRAPREVPAQEAVRFIVFDAAKDAEGVVSTWRAAMGTEPDVVSDAPSFTRALSTVRPEDALAVMTHGNNNRVPRFSSGGRRPEIALFDDLPITRCRTLYLFACYQKSLPPRFTAERALHCNGLARTKTIERIITAMADAPDVHDPEGVRGLVKWMTEHWGVKGGSPWHGSEGRP